MVKTIKVLLSLIVISSIFIVPATEMAEEKSVHNFSADVLPVATVTPTPMPDESNQNKVQYYATRIDGTKEFLILLPEPGIKDPLIVTPNEFRDNMLLPTITPKPTP